MKFTESQFAELVALMQARETRRQQRKDKRRADRAEIRVSVKISRESSPGAPVWQTVELRDLSPRGLRLVTNQEMPAGSSFLISLPTGRGGAEPLLCRVAHCEMLGNRTFTVGAEFIGHVQVQPILDESAEQMRIQRTILD